MTERTDLDRSAARVREYAERGFTIHSLSRLTAKVLLVLAFALWFRAYWLDIQPLWQLSLDGILAFTLDVLLVCGLAFAAATVPPIFLSSLVADSPADIVLNRVRRRVGWFGFAFAMAGAAALSVNSFLVLLSYWQSRALIPESTLAGADTWTLARQAIATLLLMVGFPAWALNKLAPDKWVDAMIQAREALRIQRIIEIEETAGKAMVAKMHTLLMADLATLALHERATNNAEVAAILAASQRAGARSLRMVGHAVGSLANMDMFIQTENDQQINDRYQYVARLLTEGASVAGRTATYAGALIDVTPEPSTTASERSMDASVDARGRSVEGSTADHGGPPRTMDEPVDDVLAIARRAYGQEPWKRADLQTLLRCSKSQAAQYIADWRAEGEVHELTEQKYTYVFVAEGGR